MEGEREHMGCCLLLGTRNLVGDQCVLFSHPSVSIILAPVLFPNNFRAPVLPSPQLILAVCWALAQRHPSVMGAAMLSCLRGATPLCCPSAPTTDR